MKPFWMVKIQGSNTTMDTYQSFAKARMAAILLVREEESSCHVLKATNYYEPEEIQVNEIELKKEEK